MFLTQNLMIVLVLLVLSILSFESTSADPTYVSHACSNGNTYVSNSSYQQNLNTLLSSLPGKVRDSGGFHNDTAGNGPSKVHGLFLCRDNESSPTCQDCVNFAAGDVTKRCRLAKEAVIWYDECLLRYSDRYIFSVMDTNLNYTWRNTTNFTDPERLNNLTKKLIGGTAEEAVNSSRRLATKVSNVTVAFQKQSFLVNFRMHSILQCTLDLSTGDCDRCLRGAIAMLPTCCNVTMEARLYFPSCYVRYGIHSFSNETMPPVRRQSPAVPAAPRPDGSRPRTPASIPPSPSPTDSVIKPPGGKDKKLKEIAIGAATAGFVLVVLLCYWLWCLLRKNKTEERQPKKNNELLHLRDGRIREDYLLTGEKQDKSEDFPLLPLSLMLEATQNFSEENKLGQGGFGPVFKGVLPDGKELAVKRLSKASAQGLKEFKNEVTLIAKLQHKNLVRLFGCCLEGDELMLVYEYMPNKSLDFFIFDPTRQAQLDWKRRISIINGIARGILYLHEDSRLRIIHRDLKAGNVLLDHEMNPKISDFGMARIFGGNQTDDNTKRPVGTYGYMAPEYAMEGLFSVKSDVFSFGVLLLEIISGKRNTRFHLAEEGQSLLTYTWKLWCEGRAVEVMDPVLMQSCALGEALRCIQIGLLCVQEDPADRPTMSTVVLMLGSVNMLLPQPTEPAFSVGRVVMRANRSSPNVRCSTNQVTLSTLSGR